MNKFNKNILIASGLILIMSTEGCDSYYAVNTSTVVTPMYDQDGVNTGSYYHSRYLVGGYGPSYFGPYVETEYSWVW